MERKIDHLRTQLKDGRISRREFMNRLMVLGVATTTAGSLATWAQSYTPTTVGRPGSIREAAQRASLEATMCYWGFISPIIS